MRRWNCFQGAKLLPCIQWVDLLTLLVRNFGDLYNDADKNADNNCVQISTCATLLMTWWCWNRCYTFFITRAQFVGLRSWTLILWSPVKVVFPTYWYIYHHIYHLWMIITYFSIITYWWLVYRFQNIITYLSIITYWWLIHRCQNIIIY